MTVLELALKLMLFIVVGYIARKLKVMADGFDKMLTRFVMAVPLPCMIINSFNIEFSVDLLMDAPVLLALSVGSMLAVYLVVHFCTMGIKSGLKKTTRFALMFTNFTFMGLPIVAELYGAQGAFNYVIFTLPIRIIFYGASPIILGKGGEKLNVRETVRQFLCEPVVAVFIGFLLYVSRIQLPGVIVSVMEGLGGMASPLGLILCGAIIADAKWSGITKYPSVFIVTALRLLVVPAFVMAAFLLIGVDGDIVRSTVFYYAMPVASFLPTFLLRYNSEAVEARVMGGYMVVVSTLLCIATTPLWTIILEKFC